MTDRKYTLLHYRRNSDGMVEAKSEIYYDLFQQCLKDIHMSLRNCAYDAVETLLWENSDKNFPIIYFPSKKILVEKGGN